MRVVFRLSSFLLALSVCLFVSAEKSPSLTASSSGARVRFTSFRDVAQIRLQITGMSGNAVYDSGWRGGNVFDWTPDDAGALPLANGTYRCSVSLKDLDGIVTEREATLIAQDGQISIEQRGASDMLTVVGANDGPPRITMLVHDGTSGSIVSTTGDLSFRFGDFPAGKDNERMRLTAAGNLGIGTDKPQAPLDVNGLIRTNAGIMFSDGTILTTAAGLSTSAEKPGPGPRAQPTSPIILRGAVDPLSSARPFTSSRLTPRPTAAPDYQFKVDSAGVHIGTTSAFGLDVAGDVNLASNLSLPASSATGGVIMLGGTRFVHGFANNAFIGRFTGNFTMTGNYNTGSGDATLQSNTNGSENTATGASALQSNTTGSKNTANGVLALFQNGGGHDNAGVGHSALFYNTSGNYNIAVGSTALYSNTTGNDNVAVGALTLLNSNGSSNIAIGRGALPANTSGDENVGIGLDSLKYATTGSSNVAIGPRAGLGIGTGTRNVAIGANAGGTLTSNNIEIGTFGDKDGATDSNTIRIGNQTGGAGLQHTRAFIGGVYGIAMGQPNYYAVYVDSYGQLGTLASSATVKQEIASIGDTSSDLLKLRPVSFLYCNDTVGIRQYGLIAEEVAEVMPDLVHYSETGQPDTVQYHFLPPLMLNELQKQHKQIEQQQVSLDTERQENAALRERIERLERIVEGLKARQ